MTDLVKLNAWQLVEAFAALRQALEDWSKQVARLDYPCYQPPQNSLASAAQCYCLLTHQNQDDGRQTPQFHGVIALPETLLKQAERLNQLKADFQAMATQWNRHHGRQRNRALSDVLRNTGYARVQLKLCYRQIPILCERPDKIQFSWYTSGRSIKKITPEQAQKALEQFDTAQLHIATQLEQLSRLPADTPLAQVQPQAALIRANISWQKQDQTQRKAFNSALPILIPEPDKGLPHIRDRTLEPAPTKRARQVRSDVRIEAEAFLPSIRVHRYKA